MDGNRKYISQYFLLIISIIVTALVFLKCISFTRIPTCSMEPTIEPGSSLCICRLCNEPKRFSVISFKEKHSKQYLVKRIIGLPGDRISLIGKDVYVNGKKLSEKYAITDKGYDSKAYIVPKDKYFVMGDNRSHSFDSRRLKGTYISKSDIYGLAIFTINKQGINVL